MSTTFTTTALGIVETTKKVEKALTKDFRFATSVSLNRTGLKAQKHLVERLLPDTFTLRNNWWKPGTRLGFNLDFSTKDRLQARLFSRAPFLLIHTTGGTERPTTGKFVAIPTREARPDPRKPVARRFYVGNIARPLKFVRSVGAGLSLFARIARRRAQQLYFLRRSVTVKKTFPFFERLRPLVAESVPVEFDRAFTEVLEGTFKKL